MFGLFRDDLDSYSRDEDYDADDGSEDDHYSHNANLDREKTTMSDTAEKLIKVVSYKTFGTGKVGECTFDFDGREQKMKAWASDEWEPGQERTVYFQEKEKYGSQTGEMEWWLVCPKERKPAATGNTGFRKGNPGTGTTREDFLTKWTADREADAIRQSSIVAQVILKCSVEMEIAGSGNVPESPNVNNVKGYADDLAEVFKSSQLNVYEFLKSCSGGD
jgi:hypothetical protein